MNRNAPISSFASESFGCHMEPSKRPFYVPQESFPRGWKSSDPAVTLKGGLVAEPHVRLEMGGIQREPPNI